MIPNEELVILVSYPKGRKKLLNETVILNVYDLSNPHTWQGHKLI